MKLKYICTKIGKIGNCNYVIRVEHFGEFIEKIQEHDKKAHETEKDEK